GAQEDGALHHALDPRGGVPGRPRAGDDAAPRAPDGRRAGGHPAPAQPRRHEHARVRPLRASHPQPVQRQGRGGRMKWTARNVGLTALLFVAIIAAWEAVVRIFQIPVFILPSPTQVGMALYRGLATGLYVEHLKYTLLETLLGFIAGSALGFFLGTAVAMNRHVEFFFYPYIVMFQSLPKVALAPPIVVWFGLGLTSKVINAALVAFFPLLVNTMVGLKSADEDRVSLMRSLAA